MTEAELKVWAEQYAKEDRHPDYPLAAAVLALIAEAGP